MEQRKCPTCGNVITSTSISECPVCHFRELDRMFLTLDDYEVWREEVLEPYFKKWNEWKCYIVKTSVESVQFHIKIRRDIGEHRVSAGQGGGLVLLGDGKLYGFGDNLNGQYYPTYIGKTISEPLKIADDVISMAVGYNFSVYLDADGRVYFLENSEY